VKRFVERDDRKQVALVPERVGDKIVQDKKCRQQITKNIQRYLDAIETVDLTRATGFDEVRAPV
jgi:hypothetical protein